MMRLLFAGLALGLTLLSLPALAHKPSDSYLSILGEPDDLRLRWDIALRDLDNAIGLDRDGDGAITWGELRDQQQSIADYALARLTLNSESASCAPGTVDLLVDDHSDGAYAVLMAGIDCPASTSGLEIGYDLFFDLDLQHRGLLNVTVGSVTTSVVIDPDDRQVTVDFGEANPGLFTSYFLNGAHHLLSGADHLLFLLVVLLPIAFRGSGSAKGSEVIETFKILTAFTIAHGLTLSAAVLGYLALPSTPVEVVIALTIALTAIDNIKPFLGGRRWLVVGAFGLVHGLGFASVLGPLDLPPLSMALALFAFNMGIELTQLAIALLLLLLGWVFQHYFRPASPAVSNGGSCLAFTLAGLWVIDRSFDLGMMPF